MEKFAIGLLLGGLGGALLAANSCKMRTLVRKGQEEVKARLDEIMDEKIREMESKSVETPQVTVDEPTTKKAKK
jgi:hypothetical protein